MVELTIRDSQGYIAGLPPEAVEPLMLATSFRPVGFQYTRAFQKGKTDGRVKLVKASKFPAGLAGRICDTLTGLHVPWHLTVEKSEDDKPSLGMRAVGIEKREYQDLAVEAALLNPRGIIRAPTGAGKTAIGARIIAVRDKWALVIVPTIDLLYQYKGFLEEHLELRFWDGAHCPACGQLGTIEEVARDDRARCEMCPWTGTGRDLMRIGQLGDGIVDPQPVTVATVRTAAAAMSVAYTKYEFGEYDDKDDTKVSPSELREWLSKIGTLLIDEAHILGAETVYGIATKLTAPNKYGMSASPWRDDGADLMIEAATGKVISRISARKLVEQKYLVPPVIEVVDTSGWWTPAAWGQTCQRCGRIRPMESGGPAKKCVCGDSRWRSEFTDAYRHEIVENAIRNMRIAEIVKGLDGPTLVLVKQIKHGKLLEQAIPGCRFLSGRDPGTERAGVYEDIRNEQLQVVIATTIADMGLDVPALRNLVLAGGGKSSTRHLQRIGRVARPYPGKSHARIIDFDDSHVHRWFRDHAKARRKIERAEWGDTALWI